ncbi:hypothetical protein [Prosthecochloris sp. GSB1]|uniref:hypothetical protein n=1 Tax=Prosthecochloris sp. GSB1 TaxID=281093 RepID=UPI0012374607|nr:hypothetical protein [Prosthecochloris sp. GSB1]
MIFINAELAAGRKVVDRINEGNVRKTAVPMNSGASEGKNGGARSCFSHPEVRMAASAPDTVGLDLVQAFLRYRPVLMT